jgi:hypothetical protein
VWISYKWRVGAGLDMNCRMHSSRVPSETKYELVLLMGSFLSEGHFLRTAGASKFI